MEFSQSESIALYANDFEKMFEVAIHRCGWTRNNSDSLSFIVCLDPPDLIKKELIRRALDQGLAVTFANTEPMRCCVTVVNLKQAHALPRLDHISDQYDISGMHVRPTS